MNWKSEMLLILNEVMDAAAVHMKVFRPGNGMFGFTFYRYK